MTVTKIETRLSKAGNEYEVARLDTGHIILKPDWLTREVKLPLEVQSVIKDYGQWTIAPILR